MAKIILFDGVCNLCNSSVNFIIDRDPKKNFKFASIQSNIGQSILKKEKSPYGELLNSVVYKKNEKIYFKSDAALQIARELSFPWNSFFLLIVVPPFIRDFFYDLIAKNRYRLFGKRESCRMPSPEIKERFLEDSSFNSSEYTLT